MHLPGQFPAHKKSLLWGFFSNLSCPSEAGGIFADLFFYYFDYVNDTYQIVTLISAQDCSFLLRWLQEILL